MSNLRRLVLLAYPAIGLALGLADPRLGELAGQAGFRPGVATAVGVNALMPLAAVVLALLHRRVVSALLGAAAMTAAFVAGLAFRHAPAGGWSAASLAAAVPPVLFAACVGYAVLGVAAALLARRLGASQERSV